MKNHTRLTHLTNAVDPATSSPCWGKKPNKWHKGVAGKGGATTNFEIKDTVKKEEK